MTTALAERPTNSAIESVLIQGDLSKLSESQRLEHYRNVCGSLGLNPLTQPFDYIRLNSKLVLYAKRDAAEQLRKLHGVSITEMTTQMHEDVYVVTVKAQDKTGRMDMSTGAVATGNLKGENLANALLKAETKAKRRVTLSICGLGMLDETEVETIRQDPAPPLVVETQALPPAPEGAHYIAEVGEVQRRRGYEWANVTTTSGELFLADMQCLKLLEQLAQEKAPVVLEIEKTSKGFSKIVEAHRYVAEPVVVAPAEPATSF